MGNYKISFLDIIGFLLALTDHSNSHFRESSMFPKVYIIVSTD